MADPEHMRCVETGCPTPDGVCRYRVAGSYLAGSRACLTTDMGGSDPEDWTYSGYLQRARVDPWPGDPV